MQSQVHILQPHIELGRRWNVRAIAGLGQNSDSLVATQGMSFRN